MRDMRDMERPPGWDYNPASWGQRLPIVALALAGFVIAAYLALYQYRVVGDVWEPFFGEGSRTILDSELSRVLPVSDAALGAFAFLVDAVTGAIGGRARWRTMPWLVIVFGFFVGPLSAVSVALVIAQPVLYDSWCTLCLASAVVSNLMIGPAMDEVLASLQYIGRARARGEAWRAFWGRPASTPRDAGLGPEGPVPHTGGERRARAAWAAWAQGACALLGVWIMAAPGVLGYGGPVRTSDHIAGPLIASFGCVAVWGVTRGLRWVNVPLGLWMVVAGWVLSRGEPIPAINGTAAGLLVAALSLVPGRARHRVGGGWRAVWEESAGGRRGGGSVSERRRRAASHNAPGGTESSA